MVSLTRDRPDKWFWEPEIEGIYTVKSAYKLLQGIDEEETISAFSILWQSAAPSNVKAFGWRTLWGRIQTKENLKRRRIIQTEEELTCSLCLNVEETMEHLRYNRWFRIRAAVPDNCRMHFLQHGLQLRNKGQRAVIEYYVIIIFL
ncbi:uncharacterized protein LOC130743899 [Lotus japonicus]|uniref:uncharacterized protein LOC130743899 n=1 Tax=Lotus japonicus TaxID=34305 RepID=UPI002582CC45|nr:uncharacterized protein LOC130743899 [Lotus japonicus]